MNDAVDLARDITKKPDNYEYSTMQKLSEWVSQSQQVLTF